MQDSSISYWNPEITFLTKDSKIEMEHSFCKHHMFNLYHEDMNEQNSGENWSEGAQGSGCLTIAATSWYTLAQSSLRSGGEYGNWPVAHCSITIPRLQMSLL